MNAIEGGMKVIEGGMKAIVSCTEDSCRSAELKWLVFSASVQLL